MKYKRLLSVAISRVSGTIFNFFFTVYIAKYLGAKETGIIFFSITLITLASLVTRFGFDHILMKLVAPMWEKRDSLNIISIINFAILIIASLSFGVYFILKLVLLLMYQNSHLSKELFNAASGSLCYIFPLGVLWALSAAAKAMNSPNIAGFIESGAIPFLTLILIFVKQASTGAVNSSDVVFYYGISIVFIIMMLYFFIAKKNKFLLRINAHSYHLIKDNLKACFNIMVMSVSNYALIWLPVFYLTMLVSEESAGIYSTLQRIAMLVSFILIIFNSLLAPRFSILFQKKELAKVEALTKSSIKKMLIITLPVVAFILIFSKELLTLLGNDFTFSSDTLGFLIATQLINVFFGPVIYILTMSGNEKNLSKITLMILFSSFFYGIILISNFGLLGAAISTLLNITLLNYLAQRDIYKVLNISTNIFNLNRK